MASVKKIAVALDASMIAQEGARRATLEARGFAIEVRLAGVSGFDGESTDLGLGRSLVHARARNRRDANELLKCIASVAPELVGTEGEVDER